MEEDVKKQETFSKRAITLKQEEIEIEEMMITRDFKGCLILINYY